MLLERGLALPKDIEMALTIAPRFGGRLGDALVRLGVLRPMELVRAVVDQMKRRFIEVVGWKRGQLSFVSEMRCQDEETVPQAFNPFELIARGIVEGYSHEDLSRLLAPLEQAVLVPPARAPVSVAWLKLDAPELSVLSSVTTEQTLLDVRADAAARGIEGDHVLRAIFIGLSSGVLVSPAWPLAYRERMPTIHDR
jgi:serine/threonine-protein kinase